MKKHLFLMAPDPAAGNGEAPKKAAAKIKTVKVRNVTGQPINLDGILLPPAETVKGKVSKEAPVVEVPENDRARLGELVEDVA
jgi:hypothetical protein